MSDDTPDARERAEAEALARALDGAPAPGAPADALETAALLRHARGHDRASAERLAHVRERALVAPVRRLTPKRITAGLSMLGAAAAIALGFVHLARDAAPEQSAAVEAAGDGVRTKGLGPSAALRGLLDAQRTALRSPGAPLDALATATAPRRRELLASLEERYGGQP
jgi:hypothetical protein